MNAPDKIRQALDSHGRGDLQTAERLYREVLESEPGDADALHYLGVIHLQGGRFEEAVKLISESIRRKPDYADAMVNLGYGFSALGRFEAAVEQFDAALTIGPATAILHANLAGAKERLGHYAEAIEHFRKTLEIQPELSEARRSLADTLLKAGRTDEALVESAMALQQGPISPAMQVTHGNILLASGKLDEAIARFREVLSAQAGAAPVRASLARALRQAGDFDAAVSEYEKCLEQAPDQIDAHAELGTIYKELGRPDDAAAAFRELLDIDPRNARAWQGLASTGKDLLNDADVSHLAELLCDKTLKDDNRILLTFTLGSVRERRGEHHMAEKCYLSGNELKRSRFDYDIDSDLQAFENFRRLDEAFFEKWHGSGIVDNKPIFIVGMPRSGTSLVEQILASHPKVFGAGERTLLTNSIVRFFPIGDGPDYTSALADATAEQFQEAAKAYLAGLPRSGAERITDKLPHNFLNIGMIRMLFPNAGIVHCRRDPRDTCFSIYKHQFGADSHFYAYDLEELGRYYNAYAKLMSNWDAVLPGVVHTIDYERLVDDQEQETRALLNACGLDWDPACLAFHETERPVATISAAQVRRPIYRGSIGAWKDYETMLAPLLEILEYPDERHPTA